METDKLNAFHT